MKKIIVLATVLLLCSAKFSFADEVMRKQLAEKLLVTMKSEEQFKKNFEQMKKTQDTMLENVPGYKRDPVLEKKTMDAVNADFSYEKMHDDIVNAYATVFTEEELQGLISFFETPLGQAYVAKMPELTKHLMEANQARMRESQGKMQQMFQENMKNMPTAQSMQDLMKK